MRINIKSLYRHGALGASLLFAVIITVVATGCSHTVHHTVDERFASRAPHTVAVLPIEWAEGSGALDTAQYKDVARVFRAMTYEKLRTLDYLSPTPESVDRVLGKRGSSATGTTSPADFSKALDTDAVLKTEIIEWESNIVVTYAYLKVKARFSLYSKEGVKLWSAEYDTTESDIRMDKETMELAIIKVYEPRVQRFINDVFSTLPLGNASSEKKRYFDWLP
ncbi:MAG: hypothetical protein IME99_03165 [Proteobacteria bacterium]|nr:hypothetical protein [Pseudomonadota bacterium]